MQSCPFETHVFIIVSPGQANLPTSIYESVSRCYNHYQIQNCIPAYMMNSECFTTCSLYSISLKDFWMDKIASKTLTTDQSG